MDISPKIEHKVDESLPRLIGDRINRVQDYYSQFGLTAVLVGSLGRSASVKRDPKSLETYEGFKDIDFLILGNQTQEEAKQREAEAINIAYPIRTEEHFRDKVVVEDGKTFIKYKDIKVQIDPRVLTPRKGLIFGTEVDTLDPNTVFHLTALYGPIRYKDWNSLINFGREIRQSENVIPEELFEPFHKLTKEREDKYPNDTIIAKLKWLYHKHVPYEKRVNAKLVKVVKKILKNTCGYIDVPLEK